MGKWLIWSNEHGMWWKAKENGYTFLYHEAGEYDPDDKDRILKNANEYAAGEFPNEIGILVLDDES